MTHHKSHRCQGTRYSSHTPGSLENGAIRICSLFQSKGVFYGRNARCRGGNQHKVNARSRSESTTTRLRKSGSVMPLKLYNRWDAGPSPRSGSRRSIPRRSVEIGDAHTGTLISSSNLPILTTVAFPNMSAQTPTALDHPTGRSSKSLAMSTGVS